MRPSSPWPPASLWRPRARPISSASRWGSGSWRRSCRQSSAAVPLLLACGLLVLLPNLPGYVRNLDYSGSPIGQGARSTNNTAFGLGPLVVNGVRNLATNLATQNSGYDRWLTRVVTEGLAGLGLDASDPRLTFIESKFEASTYQTSEDIAGQPRAAPAGHRRRAGDLSARRRHRLPAPALRPLRHRRHPAVPGRAALAALDHAAAAADLRPRRPPDRLSGLRADPGLGPDRRHGRCWPCCW